VDSCTNHRAAVLAALREGPRDSRQLNAICYRYGARIGELRDQGWPIEKKLLNGRIFLYWMGGPRGAPRGKRRRLFVVIAPQAGVDCHVEGPFADAGARHARLAQLAGAGQFHADELFTLETGPGQAPSLTRHQPE
jgi:hypothetical protein